MASLLPEVALRRSGVSANRMSGCRRPPWRDRAQRSGIRHPDGGYGSVVTQFRFRFHPLYRVLGLPFGITEGTTSVEVSDNHLTVRFGPWRLRTPLSNIASCERTGPYTVPKTAGPAHLSLADRGVTFATNPDAGLCLRFDEPVAAIDPFGWIRHPAATVTVDRLDDLALTVSHSPSGANQ